MYVCMYVRTYEQCVSMRHFCWYNNFKIFHHEAILVKSVSQLKFPETNRLQQRKKYQARYDMTKNPKHIVPWSFLYKLKDQLDAIVEDF